MDVCTDTKNSPYEIKPKSAKKDTFCTLAIANLCFYTHLVTRSLFYSYILFVVSFVIKLTVSHIQYSICFYIFYTCTTLTLKICTRTYVRCTVDVLNYSFMLLVMCDSLFCVYHHHVA